MLSDIQLEVIIGSISTVKTGRTLKIIRQQKRSRQASYKLTNSLKLYTSSSSSISSLSAVDLRVLKGRQ